MSLRVSGGGVNLLSLPWSPGNPIKMEAVGDVVSVSAHRTVTGGVKVVVLTWDIMKSLQ